MTASDGSRRSFHMPPPLIYAAALLVGILLDRQVPFAIVTSAWVEQAQLGSRVLLVLGAGLVLSALLLFQRKKTPVAPGTTATSLLVGGPYRFTRNPIYLGFLVMSLGACLRFNTWWAAIALVPATIYFDRVIIPREEKHLTEIFGEPYVELCRRVRRWI